MRYLEMKGGLSGMMINRRTGRMGGAVRFIPENDHDRALLLEIMDRTGEPGRPGRVIPDGDGRETYRTWANTVETDGVFTATAQPNEGIETFPATGEVRCVNGVVLVIWKCPGLPRSRREADTEAVEEV